MVYSYGSDDKVNKKTLFSLFSTNPIKILQLKMWETFYGRGVACQVDRTIDFYFFFNLKEFGDCTKKKCNSLHTTIPRFARIHISLSFWL